MAGESKYNDMQHPALRAVVDKTMPDVVLKRAAQLQDAGRVLGELSTALQAHLGQVHWEGPAAENFKTWVGNLYKSADIIGQHSTTAGGAMTQAGEALSTAKVAMPPLPQPAIDKVAAYEGQRAPAGVEAKLSAVGQTIDQYMKASGTPEGNAWVTEAEYKQAKATVEKERQEAVHQVENLAQAYTAATATLNGIPDDVTLPGTPEANQNDSSSVSGGGTGGGGAYGGSVRSPRSYVGSGGGSYSPSGGGSYGGGSVTPYNPGTGSTGPSGGGHTTPAPPYSGGQLPSNPQDPGTSTPPSHPSDPVNRPGTGLDGLPTAPPTQTGPGGGPVPTGGPTTPTYPTGPTGPTGPGGGPNTPGGGPVPGFPVGPGGGSVQTKGGGTGYVPGKGGSVNPRTPFGGQTVGRNGTPGIPSGTVFGSREAGPGGGRVGGQNGMNGMGMHPGMGGGHGVAGGSGGSRGRGLASTTGGTVGGRKGPTAGGEFTPGGTGLRNRAAAAGGVEGGARPGQNGMMAPGMGGHGNRKERDRRNRADYLHEDEETWTSGTPHSNPDVIE